MKIFQKLMPTSSAKNVTKKESKTVKAVDYYSEMKCSKPEPPMNMGYFTSTVDLMITRAKGVKKIREELEKTMPDAKRSRKLIDIELEEDAIRVHCNNICNAYKRLLDYYNQTSKS